MEKNNPCYYCHGGCCRNYVLTIQIWDAYKIVKNTNYHFDDFVLYINHEIAGIPSESKKYFLQFSEDPFVYFSMNLKREQSKLIDGPKCIFLKEELRKQEEFPDNMSSTHLGRKIKSYCSIYEYRPMMCNIYPFAWNGAFLEQKSRDINDNFCPDDWKNYNINSESKTKILNDNSFSRFISSAEANLIFEWNKTDKDKAKFENFVVNYFNNLFKK
jgi:Fe-S-cluster containining protein